MFNIKEWEVIRSATDAFIANFLYTKGYKDSFSVYFSFFKHFTPMQGLFISIMNYKGAPKHEALEFFLIKKKNAKNNKI